MENTDHAAEGDPLTRGENRTEPTTDPELKKESSKEVSRCSKMGHWRTAAFFLSLFLCLTIVFAFSFVIPCPVRPQYSIYWNRSFTGARTFDFLAIEHANSDKVMDVLFVLKNTEGTENKPCADQGLLSPCVYLVAVDGTDGETLWERALHPEFHWAQCGMNKDTKETWHCLVSHSNNITAINKHTGEIVWEQRRPTGLQSSLPVLSVPDQDKDGFRDIVLVASNDKQTQLVLLSGQTGTQIGSTVNLHLKNASSHLFHQSGPYILLQKDTGIFKVELSTMVAKAKSGTDMDLMNGNDNSTTNIVPMFESEVVSMVKTKRGEDFSNLLILTQKSVALLDGKTLKLQWRFNTTYVPSLPSFGHFNKDNIVDVVIEEDFGNNTKRIIILDGKSGYLLWEVHLLAPANSPRSGSVLTINSFSVFMFWGLIPSNSSESVIGDRRYYMLHPLYSNVLLEHPNIEDHILSFKTTLMERGRHAAYLLLLGPEPGAEGMVILKKQKIKQDAKGCDVISIATREVLQTEKNDVKEAFQRLRFADDL